MTREANETIDAKGREIHAREVALTEQSEQIIGDAQAEAEQIVAEARAEAAKVTKPATPAANKASGKAGGKGKSGKATSRQ